MPHLKFITYNTQDCSAGDCWGPGVQTNYALQYVTSGKGYFEVGGNKFTLTKGQCMLIESGMPVYYYADNDDPWSYCWVNFNGANAKQMLSMTGLSRCPVTPKIELTDIFDMFSSDVVNPVSHLKNEGLLYILISRIIEFYPAINYKSDLDYLHIAKRYIANNFHHSELNVNSLANAIGVERTYLFRLFKEGEGVSVIDYIINVRLNAARDMLDSGIRQVKVVAASCGYDNPLYFSNAFKKRFGMSPKHYLEGK